MNDGNISPLDLADEDVQMDGNDVTMHALPPEGGPAHLIKETDTARDKLEKSGHFTRSKVRKILAGLPSSSSPSPNDPLFQPTWTPSREVDIAFAKLYPKAMYTFTSPPPTKLPPVTRRSRERSITSQSPPYPGYRHLRRNAIIPRPDPPPTHHNRSPVRKRPGSSRPPTPATKSSSPFMDLPGELKNRIYSYSLVRPNNIEITAANWPTHQPALLKTCKQIRTEALSIFYNENDITANIDDWCPVVKNACHTLWDRYELKTAKLSHYFTGKAHWENLVAWLKAFFLGTMRGISDVVNKSRALERKTVGVMFLMATTAKNNNMPWADLEQLLLAQRGLLAKGDGRWLLLH